jgi:hypothetical protein
VEITNFRLISLEGGVYKIISKVLANRLKLLLGKIVSSSHNVFIRGRQILDLVSVATECLVVGLDLGKLKCVVLIGFVEGI